jgi:hypothetical protein
MKGQLGTRDALISDLQNNVAAMQTVIEGLTSELSSCISGLSEKAAQIDFVQLSSNVTNISITVVGLEALTAGLSENVTSLQGNFSNFTSVAPAAIQAQSEEYFTKLLAGN